MQPTGDDGAARSRRTGAEASPGGGVRRRPEAMAPGGSSQGADAGQPPFAADATLAPQTLYAPAAAADATLAPQAPYAPAAAAELVPVGAAHLAGRPVHPAGHAAQPAANAVRHPASPPHSAGDRAPAPPSRSTRPTQPGHPTLTALTDDLHRLAAPLPPGRPIVDASRPAHPSFQDAAERSAVPDGRGHGRDYPDLTADASTATSPSASAAPVFVDSSGQRRKLARRLSIAVVGILGGYVCLIAVSFAGGPIPPGVLLPVPGLPAAKDPVPQPAPAGPAAPSGSANASHSARPGTSSTGRVVDRTPAHASQSSTSAGAAAPSTAPSSALPTTPQPSAPATSASFQSHGNPTPPGRVKHSSPASGPTT